MVKQHPTIGHGWRYRKALLHLYCASCLNIGVINTAKKIIDTLPKDLLYKIKVLSREKYIVLYLPKGTLVEDEIKYYAILVTSTSSNVPPLLHNLSIVWGPSPTTETRAVQEFQTLTYENAAYET